MKVSVLTVTKDRPEALSLCKRWVDHQTYAIHEWIVIEGMDYCEGLVLGAEKAKGDLIVIFDDDDWYDRRYVASVVGLVDRSFDVVAALWTGPYHIRARAYQTYKRFYGLSNTLSFKPNICGAWRELWESGRKMKDIRSLPTATHMHKQLMVPIKGLYPGGAGMSVMQTYASSKYPIQDPELAYLESKVGGEAVEHYIAALKVIDSRLASE